MQRSVRGGTFTISSASETIRTAIRMRRRTTTACISASSNYRLPSGFHGKGEPENPFTPLKYGVFVGFDYGRAWFPGEQSKRWLTSYGGDIWLTLINKITTKYSCFGSTDSFRFMFELGLGF